MAVYSAELFLITTYMRPFQKKTQVTHAGLVLGVTLKFRPVYLYLQSYGNTGLYHYASLCGTEGKPKTLCMTVLLTYIMLCLHTKKMRINN